MSDTESPRDDCWAVRLKASARSTTEGGFIVPVPGMRATTLYQCRSCDGADGSIAASVVVTITTGLPTSEQAFSVPSRVASAPKPAAATRR